MQLIDQKRDYAYAWIGSINPINTLLKAFIIHSTISNCTTFNILYLLDIQEPTLFTN